MIDTYKLYTDTRGHAYFTLTNDYAAAIQSEFNIDAGEAQMLHYSAMDHLRRTGGYDNPADSIGTSDEDSALSVVMMAALATSTLSALFV